MASASAALAQDATGAPVFQLTGTGGVVGFSIPTFDTGFFDHAAGGNLFGGMLGLNASAAIGNLGGDFDVIVGFNAFGAFGMGSSSWTDTFSGEGSVLISGMTLPSGGTSIMLAPAGSPQVEAVGTTRGKITAGSGAINAGFLAPDNGGAGPGFIGGVYAEGAGGSQMAGGFIADTWGGIVAAAGDLDGLTITTSASRSLTYAGANLTLGIGGNVSDTVALQVYGGPSYRGLGTRDQTDVTIDFPEAGPTAVTFPTFTIGQTDTITGHYLGGLVGMSASVVTSPGVVFSLGIEGGVYSVTASWTGSNTFSTCCGNLSDPGGGVVSVPVGTIDGPSPALSVSSAAMTHDFGSAMAVNARANAGVTYAVDTNKAVTIGGSAEYLSHVAQIDRGQQLPGAPTFRWGSMFSFTGTLSVTGTFQ